MNGFTSVVICGLFWDSCPVVERSPAGERWAGAQKQSGAYKSDSSEKPVRLKPDPTASFEGTQAPAASQTAPTATANVAAATIIARWGSAPLGSLTVAVPTTAANPVIATTVPAPNAAM